MKLTLSNPTIFLFFAKNSAGDSANKKPYKLLINIHTKIAYIYIYMQERERERLTLLENAILSLRFFGGFCL